MQEIPENIERQLNSLLLCDLEFFIEDKCIKRGKLISFSPDNSYIRLRIQRNESKTENFDIPVCFNVFEDENSIIFDYTLKTLADGDIELFVKLNNVAKVRECRFFNTKLRIQRSQ